MPLSCVRVSFVFVCECIFLCRLCVYKCVCVCVCVCVCTYRALLSTEHQNARSDTQSLAGDLFKMEAGPLKPVQVQITLLAALNSTKQTFRWLFLKVLK